MNKSDPTGQMAMLDFGALLRLDPKDSPTPVDPVTVERRKKCDLECEREKQRMERIKRELEDQKKNDPCEFRNSAGTCVYKRDEGGNLVLDNDYAKKACEDYKKMMLSNKLFGAGAGATNLPGLVNAATGGKYEGLAKVSRFFSSPGFVYMRGVTYVTTLTLGLGSSPPPGCN